MEEETRGDDWCFRFAAGHSRRANSVNPLRPVTGDIAAVISDAQTAYAARGLPTIFRLPSIVDEGIAPQLAARGYTAEGETITLHCDLPAMPMRRDPDVIIDPRLTDDWLAGMSDLQGHSAERRQSYRAILGRLEIPAAFITFRVNGDLAAMAYGGLQGGLLCLESVITAEALRGRGYASRILGALLAWAIEQGASGACLQVEAQNTAARKLYRGMGFIRELYRYQYWRGPG